MEKNILRSSKITKECRPLVGEKAYNLSLIPKSKTYKVPKFFVITTIGMDDFLQFNGIKRNSPTIIDDIKKGKFPVSLKKSILKEFANINSRYLAVRSSSRMEDREKAMAGRFKTEIGVSKSKLFEAIKSVWVSSFQVEKKSKMAVIVQELIEADSSGVAFTNSSLGNTIVEAVFGQGELLVSGEVTPDYYSIRKDGSFFNIQVKEQKYFLKVEKGSLVKKSTKKKNWFMKLDWDNISDLSKSIGVVQDKKSNSRDIEFAFQGKKLYILQDRPGKKIIERKINFAKDVIRENSFLFLPELQKRMNSYFKKELSVKAPRSIDTYHKGTSFFTYYDVAFEYRSIFYKLINKYRASKKMAIERLGVIESENKHLGQIIETFSHRTDHSKSVFLKLFSAIKTQYINTFCIRIIEQTYSKEKKHIAKKALELRSFSETFLYQTLNIINNYLKLHHKKYAKYFNVMEQVHFFEILENGKLSKNSQKVLDERLKGSFIYGYKIYSIKKLDTILKENYAEIGQPNTPKNFKSTKGDVVFHGKVKGYARVIKHLNDCKKFKKGEVLISHMTSINMIDAIKLSSAIVTDEGGVLCHAAINAREYKKPCIVDTKTATKIFKTGDVVYVDTKKKTASLKP